MKILMHCVYYPPEVGGLESHVHSLCRGLVARGHDVAIVTSRSIPGIPSHEVVDGVQIDRTWFPGRHAAGWVGHALGSVPATIRRARSADILHAQAFSSIPPLQAAAAATGGRGLVATLHTSHFLKLASRPLWKPLLGRLVQAADRTLAASGEIADVAMGLAPGTAVEAVTNGVETDIFRPTEPALGPTPEGIRRIIVPRRLFPKNGVEYFIRAMPAIVRSFASGERTSGGGASTGRRVEAVLVGDGPERERLVALAAELGVAEQVRFLGARAHKEMPALLSSADLAVFPSLMEATSVAALECMACGVPVAASRVGGLPEIVDDSVGGLFRPADPEDLARVVAVLLHRDDLAALGRTARARVVDRWSNERLVDRHLEIYEDVIRRRGASRGNNS
jgi:glycosyltransferase involved in cell wall biosynthesis